MGESDENIANEMPVRIQLTLGKQVFFGGACYSMLPTKHRIFQAPAYRGWQYVLEHGLNKKKSALHTWAPDYADALSEHPSPFLSLSPR